MSKLPTTRAELARRIDHTLLKAEATQLHVDRLCDECLKYKFAAACVNPTWVSRCANRLAGSTTAVATVVGFPLGATGTKNKVFEATTAVVDGAREIDMVVHLGALVALDRTTVERDIAAVVEASKHANANMTVKVILETAALSDEQILLGCECAADAGADYVKTSTGFHPAGGATVEHVTLLKKNARSLKVKASGGIRDLNTALAMLEAGADRLGVSAGVAIVEAMNQ